MNSWRHLSADRIAGWLPRVVEIVLVVAMAWVVSGWFAGGDMPRAPSPASGGGTAAMPPVQAIASVPLFGASAAASAATAAVKPAMPVAKSRLAIQLLGTVVAGRRSAAVVALHPGATQKVFLLGQALEAGVILKAVEPEAIAIDNHGRMERIAMAKLELSMAPLPAGGGADGGAHINISRAGLNAQLQNLPKLLTQAQAIPHQMHGKPDGIMIDDIAPGSLYAKAGLKNFDVIRSVNGHPVRRMDQGIRLFQQLKDQHSIDLEIARGGAIRHLHYTIQ